jgi:hypothetical protein
MKLIPFASWPALLEHIATGGAVYYHAPMDHAPVRVRVEVRRGSKLRVFPPSRAADAFTADSGHLERFRQTAPDWRGAWELQQSQFVEATWLRMMRDPGMRRLYGYVRPTDGVKWGELLTVREGEPAPDGCELIAAESIPSGDKATIARWLAQYADRLSVIPTEA